MAARGSLPTSASGLIGKRPSRSLSQPCCCAPVSFKGALLFDCDGVLVETEELHRTAYNKAFEEFGLTINGEPVVWSVSYYDKLQNTVGGGKPKMFYHFTQTADAWPEVAGRGGRAVATNDDEGMALIDELQECKTEFYKELVTQASPRPGVLALMDEAIGTPGLAVGICSASTRGGFEKVVDAVVGKERLDKLDVIIAGDDVTAKKPDPMIYNLAAERLKLENTQCIVVEDSLVGLRAAKSAGMRCVITYTSSTEAEDFYGEGADAKLLDMSSGITVSQLFDSENAPLAEILEGVRDPK
uniref:Uncharacterized protein n=1 Tax=Chrysotila carterae TaxID=13221 RepID=A0A7S4FAW9_CHRCT